MLLEPVIVAWEYLDVILIICLWLKGLVFKRIIFLLTPFLLTGWNCRFAALLPSKSDKVRDGYVFKKREKKMMVGGSKMIVSHFSLFQCKNSHSLVTFLGGNLTCCFVLRLFFLTPYSYMFQNQNFFMKTVSQFCLEFVKMCCRKVTTDWGTESKDVYWVLLVLRVSNAQSTLHVRTREVHWRVTCQSGLHVLLTPPLFFLFIATLGCDGQSLKRSLFLCLPGFPACLFVCTFVSVFAHNLFLWSLW